MLPIRKLVNLVLGLALLPAFANADLCSFTCTEQHRIRITDARKKQEEVLEKLKTKRDAYVAKWTEYRTAHTNYRNKADEFNKIYKGKPSNDAKTDAKCEVELLAANAQAAYAATATPKNEAKEALKAYQELDAKVIQAELSAKYAQCRAECETTYYLSCDLEIQCAIDRHSVEIETEIVTTEAMPPVWGKSLFRHQFPVNQTELQSTIDKFASNLVDEAQEVGPEACPWVAYKWTREGNPPVGQPEKPEEYNYEYTVQNFLVGPVNCQFKTRRQ